MSEEVLACPLCGSARQVIFDRREFRGRQVTNQRCQDCGLVYQSPRMTDTELALFYEQEYRLLYQGEQGPTAQDLTVQRLRAEALLAFYKRNVPQLTRPVVSHLDIGCSAGMLLLALQGAYACQALGVEPGLSYRQYAHQQGLEVYATLEEAQKNKAERFDLISMAHVVEHLPQPVEYLAGLRENLLLADGWLLVEVPNLHAHDCFEVAHQLSFSAHTLAQTLGKAGFRVKRLEAHGRPRSRLIPLYLTALAYPLPGASEFKVAPDRNVAMKRRAGLFHRRALSAILPRQAWERIE